MAYYCEPTDQSMALERLHETLFGAKNVRNYFPSTEKRFKFSSPNVAILNQGFPLRPQAPAGDLSLPDVDVFYQGLTLELPKEEEPVREESETLIGESETWRLAAKAAAVAKRIEKKLSYCFN